MKGTIWVYLDILFAWATMLLGLYIIDLSIDFISTFEDVLSRAQIGIVEVFVTALLFLLWLTVWRTLTVKLFRVVIGS